MDRALKERIIGATVLVVIAVLVVPVFLDGPAVEPEMVTETVTLPGQDEQNTKRQTIVLERDREEPVPAAGGAGRETRELPPAVPPDSGKEAPVATARQPSPAPEPLRQPVSQPSREPAREPPAGQATSVTSETAKPATESATGMWAVQLGSFSNQANAERLAAELRKEGYAAFLSRVQTSSEVLHRVRVGPQQNRESAEQVAARLGSDGHKGQVVPHP